MSGKLSSLLRTLALATAVVFLSGALAPTAQAQRGGHRGSAGGAYRGGAYHGGYYHGGHYHGGYYGGPRYYGYYGYRPYGFYRPYYAPYYGFGVGLGLGVGLGVYSSYLPAYGPFVPYALPPGAVLPPDGPAGSGPSIPDVPAGDRPPADNAAHLQLLVPENAEVFVAGSRTTQTGKTREFATPPLTPGKGYTYTISVRYTGPDGRPVNDTRDINFRANDWFTIDFTRPAPAEGPLPAPRPRD